MIREYEFALRVVDPGLLDKEGYAPFREIYHSEAINQVDTAQSVARVMLQAPHHYAQLLWRWKGQDMDWRSLWGSTDMLLIRKR